MNDLVSVQVLEGFKRLATVFLLQKSGFGSRPLVVAFGGICGTWTRSTPNAFPLSFQPIFKTHTSYTYHRWYMKLANDSHCLTHTQRHIQCWNNFISTINLGT